MKRRKGENEDKEKYLKGYEQGEGREGEGGLEEKKGRKWLR